MAGGMHAAAMDSINAGGKSWEPTDTSLNEMDISGAMANLERGESVEIVALSEELSQEAARILQERRLQSNPVRVATRRVVQCQEAAADGEPETKNERRSPLVRILLNRVTILTWFQLLDLKTLYADVIAGVSVGVMVIPQSMSYAKIAGLPYVVGMYSACVPTFVYGLLGQSRQLAVGPVTMVSLLVEAGLRGKLTEGQCPASSVKDGLQQSDVCPDDYVRLVFLTSLIVGVMQFAAAVLKLGFLVSFLGHPVTSGFTSGSAIIIGLGQASYILGYDVSKSHSVITVLVNIFRGIGGANLMNMLLGLVWLLCLIANQKFSQTYPRLRLLKPLGPAVACLAGTLLLWQVPALRDKYQVRYVGTLREGIMPLSVNWDFSDVPNVLPTAISVCLIGYMESIAIGKNLAAKHGYEIEAGQELFALGLSNIAGACFSCYPVTGSFSRSAVNNSIGARTQLSGVITALVVLLSILFLIPLFHMLPQFVLAAVVMNSVIPLVRLREAWRLYRVKKHDFVLWVVAFLGTLVLGVLEGIAISVTLSLAIVIYESVRPQLTILWRIPGTTIYRNVKQESSGAFIPNVFICRIGSSIYFANASFIKDMLLAYVSDLEKINPTEYMVLEMTSVVSIDSTACHAFWDIFNEFSSRGIHLAFAMVGNRVEKTMWKAGLKKAIGGDWFFPTVNEAVHYCLRHQFAKRRLLSNSSTDDGVHIRGCGKKELHMEPRHVITATEVGFSNDLHHSYTMVFISLVKDVPMIMSDITAIFRNNSITIVRAQIEPLEQGSKHSYFLRCVKSGGKLTDYQIERLREELESCLERLCGLRKPSKQGASDVVRMDKELSTESRLTMLSDSLRREQERNELMQQQLFSQGERLEKFISVYAANTPLQNETSLLADEKYLHGSNAKSREILERTSI
eukprot:TRINITY_DN23206_c0_g1_i1.p1 TRINITY_DN23206_c0_g1~~TRINITY_DN23206_c0_g1_i1.p1  ORF type:complete len:910 (+),score=126.07 TRINITY_DN23206_c0_g1_i1:102-2831(+)